MKDRYSFIAILYTDDGGAPMIIDVFMPPFRDKLTNRFVKKTLSLPAWLADLADKDGVNCSKGFSKDKEKAPSCANRIGQRETLTNALFIRVFEYLVETIGIIRSVY